MAIQELTRPYEVLVRWRDGALAGAHVQFITQVVDGDRVMAETLGQAMPVDVGAGVGFPIADILQQIHVDALAAVDAKTAALVAMTAERDTALQERDGKVAELAAAGQQIVALQAELDALKGGGIDGVPQTVSRFQARAALLLTLRNGVPLLDLIEAMMAEPSVDRMMKLAWENAQTFERQSTTLLSLAGQLGLDEAALDALFVAAAGIKA